jgi:hypothetical protein
MHAPYEIMPNVDMIPLAEQMVSIIRYVLVFLLLYFSRGFLYILLPMYMYICESLALR